MFPRDALHLCTLKEMLRVPGEAVLRRTQERSSGSLALVPCSPQGSVTLSFSGARGSVPHLPPHCPVQLWPLFILPLLILPLHPACGSPASKRFPLVPSAAEVRRSAHSVNVYTLNFALAVLEDNSPRF